jgi:hypothetical protein
MPQMLVKRFAYDVEMLVLANCRGYKIVEAPVELFFKRKIGRIKIRDIIKIANDTAAIFYRMYILRYYDRKLENPVQQKTVKKDLFYTMSRVSEIAIVDK